ncbi:THAP domain-containing protein 5-like [Chanos chanos]|uniref:THAP domain-containing protein 5 n=1 Tax=Chanos chanos TaxID=29144 RepID=A0A6J2VQM8_CHACN|nr:THAP domain-containing protein 5-like [Chanos chanos]
MPRYCAYTFCKNRGGIPAKDNKRISFYPFPLRDEVRLKKWISNMRRGEWVPSRHQYLCSEHFTEDSFDLRWGIRYLRHTAIPTIFPEHKINRSHSKKSPKSKLKSRDDDVQLIRTSSPPRKKPLILRKESRRDSALLNGLGSGSVNVSPVPAVVVVKDLPLDAEDSATELFRIERVFSGIKTDLSDSVAELAGGGDRDVLTESCGRVLSETSSQNVKADSTVTVLCCETASPLTSGEQDSDCSNPALMISAVSVDAEKEGVDSSVEGPEEGTSDGELILPCEHSYFRQDTEKEHLWRRIASLHTKITELDKREESTVAKIKSVESEIAYLKKRNSVCEERQKALEEYFTTVHSFFCLTGLSLSKEPVILESLGHS